MIKTYDNFFPEWLHIRVKEQLLNPHFSWNFPSFGTLNSDINKACFSNTPYIEGEIENFNGCDAVRYAFDCWIY